MRIGLAAPFFVLGLLASGSSFAQNAITCETIAASATLTEAEQITLGRAIASQLPRMDPAAADALQACIAAGPPQVLASFRENSATATGDLTITNDVDTDNQGDAASPS